MSEESLKNKTVKGVGWSAADAFLGQGITFIVGLVLARLLSPAEYGLIGICIIFIILMNGIVDSGFSNALIRKNDANNDDYNTMFITNLTISLLLYIFIFFSAPLISLFFERSELTSLLRVTGSILLINALSLTQVTILTKRIDFKTKTKASLVSAILSGIIGIGLACTGFGVWALVGQQVMKQFFYTVSLWYLIKWVPSLRFNIESFKYMWKFGSKLMLSSLLNNFWNQLYQIVVAKFYFPTTLGQYTKAKDFARIFSEILTSIIQRVSYPVLSQLQDAPERLVYAYRLLIKVSMLITVISMFLMGAVSEPLIYCLIGKQWQQATTFLPFICITMSLYPLHAINLNMLQVQGRSDLFLRLEIIKKFIAVIPLCLGVFVGIYSMLIGTIVTGIISFFLNSYYTGKKLGYSSWMQIKDVSTSYIIGIIIAIPVYFVKFLPLSNWSVLIIQSCLSLIILIGLLLFIKIEEICIIKQIIKNIYNSSINIRSKNE